MDLVGEQLFDVKTEKKYNSKKQNFEIIKKRIRKLCMN